MDRRRALSPVYTRQYSTASSNDSPSASPAHPHSRHASIGGAGGFSTVRRTQNDAAKQAARRLAQVMATQVATDDDNDDDDGDDLFGPPPSLVPPISRRRVVNGAGTAAGNAAGVVNGFHGNFANRTNRAPSPAPTIGRTFVEPVPSVRSSSTGRPTTIRPATVGPPALKTPVLIPPVELPTPKARAQGRFPEFGQFDSKVSENEPEAADLLDKLDLVQQENETLVEQHREAEKRREEAEARIKQLELQVASMGEGLSMEGKLIKRKEAALRQREVALAAAKRRSEGKEEIETLQLEIETIRTEAATIMDKLQDAETEAKSLRIMTQRMILTQEEEEEVMLKRCWLARYWGLAVQYGICADIAGSKYEHWSRFAPLPFEVVTSAGQKAKEDFLDKAENSTDRWSKSGRVQGDLTGEGNVETMLSVEMGLREMASLKIEDAIALSMAQRRRPNLIRDQRVAADPKFMESFELSQEESDDVLFKEAWLSYFWKRARDYRVEEDIAEERLQLWTNRTGQSPTLQDAVDVDRGLIELRKLGIEQQLWEASRKELEHHPSLVEGDNDKHDADSENSS
ncbi:coiled-coil domain-containing protein SCD2-like [Silene latifolia]|uniref:coiled-coil domain-containing protein SCD2-like n=1 Tax=Silene latifolia TaxID=37657 RepID=UPI003D782E92